VSARGRPAWVGIVAAVLVVAIAVAVTPILVVTALRVLATGTFVRLELGRDGFPP